MFRLSARKRTQLLFRATIPNSTKNPSIHDHATQKSQIVGAATTPWPREKGLTKMCARERERERERGREGVSCAMAGSRTTPPNPWRPLLFALPGVGCAPSW